MVWLVVGVVRGRVFGHAGGGDQGRGGRQPWAPAARAPENPTTNPHQPYHQSYDQPFLLILIVCFFLFFACLSVDISSLRLCFGTLFWLLFELGFDKLFGLLAFSLWRRRSKHRLQIHVDWSISNFQRLFINNASNLKVWRPGSIKTVSNLMCPTAWYIQKLKKS